MIRITAEAKYFCVCGWRKNQLINDGFTFGNRSGELLLIVIGICGTFPCSRSVFDRNSEIGLVFTFFPDS